MRIIFFGLAVFAAATSSLATSVQVTTTNSAAETEIRRHFEKLLHELREDWGRGQEGTIREVIIEASVTGDDEASGSSMYVPDKNGQVWKFQIHLQGNLDDILRDALPRQISALVLAEQVGVAPRWIGTGIGLLSESETSRLRNQRAFQKSFRDGELLPTGKLLSLREYPKDAESRSTMYVQSMAIAEFVTDRWGREALIEFGRLSTMHSPAVAIRKQFDLESVGEFDLAFRTWAVSQ